MSFRELLKKLLNKLEEGDKELEDACEHCDKCEHCDRCEECQEEVNGIVEDILEYAHVFEKPAVVLPKDVVDRILKYFGVEID